MNIKPLLADQNVALSVCELSAFCHSFFALDGNQIHVFIQSATKRAAN